MTKEVSVIIEGLQLGSEDEPVITAASGIYHFHNDRHYIQYDEKSEDGEGITKNTIKIALAKIELSKKGANSTQMIFDLKEETLAIYHTLFGSMSFDVKTTEITLSEAPDKIQVKLSYTLSANGEYLSNNQIKILVTSNR
jgi:uncharacterized beta-barrel protein YwiB (DUF1934 family)